MGLVWAVSLLGFAIVVLSLQARIERMTREHPLDGSPIRPEPSLAPLADARALHPAAGSLRPSVPSVVGPTCRPAAGRHGLPVQVLFSTAEDDEGLVILDCIACAEGSFGTGAVHPGTPFTVKARLSCSARWAVAMIETLLDRWVTTGAPVQMSFLDGAAGVEMRLSDADSRVQLPLAA